jgi:hypothetical protein
LSSDDGRPLRPDCPSFKLQFRMAAATLITALLRWAPAPEHDHGRHGRAQEPTPPGSVNAINPAHCHPSQTRNAYPTIRRLGARYPIRPSGFLSNDGQLCGPGMSEASGPRMGAAGGAGTGRRNQEIARSVGPLRGSSIRLSGTALEPVVAAGGAPSAIAPELRIVLPVRLAGRPGLPGAGLLWVCASRACARVAWGT